MKPSKSSFVKFNHSTHHSGTARQTIANPEALAEQLKEIERKHAILSLQRRRRSESSSESEDLIRIAKLFSAIRKKNLSAEDRIKKIEKVITQGTDINARDANKKNNTPLHVAVDKKRPKVIKWLLSQGANVQLLNADGKTPIDLAKDQPEILQLLIDHISINASSSDIVKLSLDLDKPDYKKQCKQVLETNTFYKVLEISSSKLSHAFTFINNEMLQAFDKAPYLFFINIKIKEEDVLIDQASLNALLEGLKQRPLIIQYGTTSSTQVYFKENQSEVFSQIDLHLPSEFANAEEFETKLISSGDEKTFNFKFLLEGLKLKQGGQFIEDQNHNLFAVSCDQAKELNQWNLLDYAIKQGDSLSARFLLFVSKWDLSLANSNGKRPLEIAAQYADADTLRALLGGPVYPTKDIPNLIPSETQRLLELKNHDGDTPLLTAVRYNNKESTHVLLQAGANWNIKDKDNLSPMDIAYQNHCFGLIQVLLENDVPCPLDLDIPALEDLLIEKEKVLKTLKRDEPIIHGKLILKEQALEALSNQEESKADIQESDDFKKIEGMVNRLKSSLKAIQTTIQKTEDAIKEIGPLTVLIEDRSRIQAQELQARNHLHELIQQGNKEEIETFIQSSSFDRYVFNIEHKSAVVTALQKEQFDIYILLRSLGFSHHPDEAEIIKILINKHKGILKPLLDANFLAPEDSYLTYLAARSRLGVNNKREYFKSINQFYQELDRIPEVSAVMQVVAKSKHLNINFDFSQDCIVDIDPNSLSQGVRGRYDEKQGKLYVGAKGADTSDTVKAEVLGTLAHEMAHFAMNLRYNNDAKPYEKYDTAKQKAFKEIVHQVFIKALPQLSKTAKAMLENSDQRVSTPATEILKEILPEKKLLQDKELPEEEKNYIPHDETLSSLIDQFINKIKNKTLTSPTPLDEVITSVFSNYGYEEWANELIVRIPHILARDKDSGLELLKKQVPELVQYYDEKINADFPSYISHPEPFQLRARLEDLNRELGGQTEMELSPLRLASVDLTKSVSKNKEFILLLETASPSLTRLHFFQDIIQHDINVSNLAIFCQLNDFTNPVRAEKIIAAYQSVIHPRLIISYPNPKEEDAALDTIITKLTALPKKRIVFITTPNTETFLKQKLSRIITTEAITVTIEKDRDYVWDDLTASSQEILLKKTVVFQGEAISLNQIVTQDTAKTIFTQHLEELITSSTMTIGKSFEKSLGEVEDYYIDRSFNSVSINKEIKTKSTFPDLLCATKEEFEDLCKKYPDKNIHWLESQGKQLIWKQSQGSLAALRDYIYRTKTSQIPEKCGWLNPKDKAKVMLISDTTGMGKTTLLKHLAEQIKKKQPDRWVVRLDLNDHTDTFKHLKKGEFKEKDFVIEFLAEKVLEIPPKSLELMLFKQAYETNNKLIVMLDSFDEIYPDYKETVMDLIHTLQSSQLEQLWITTRPHLRSFLEDELQQFAYTLELFSEKEQTNFLRGFWQKRNPSFTDTQRIECFADAIVKKKYGYISERNSDHDVNGVPLQLRMLAEIFEKSFMHELPVPETGNIKKKFKFIEEGLVEFYYSEKSEPELPEKLNLHNLYTLFIYKLMYETYVEKNKQVLSKPSVQIDFNNLFKKFKLEHQQLALYNRLNEENIAYLLSKIEIEKFKSEVLVNIKTGLENKGLIEQIINDKPQFIHPTFAEYFIADFLMEHSQDQKIQDFFLKEVLIRTQHKIIRAFVNSRFMEDPLPAVVLQAYGNRIEKLWEESENGKLWRAEKGRTVFHLALNENNFEIIFFFFNSLNAAKKDKQVILQFLDAQDIFSRTIFQALEEKIYVAEEKEGLISSSAEGEKLYCLLDFILDKEFTNREFNIKRVIGGFIDEATSNTELRLHNFLKTRDVSILLEGEPDLILYLLKRNIPPISYISVIKDALMEFSPDAERIYKAKRRWIQLINAKDANGNTPLMYAMEKKEEEAIEFLLNEGYLNIDIKNNEGKTALHFAVERGNLELVKLFIEKNADATIKDKLGRTPLDLAEIDTFQGQRDIKQAIIITLESRILQQKAEFGGTGSMALQLHIEGISIIRSSLKDCLPGPSSRQKRNTLNKACEISWDDADEFNGEEEKVRNFDAFKLNSGKFLAYLDNHYLSDIKYDQLLQLADTVPLIGDDDAKARVKALIDSHKETKYIKRLNNLHRLAGGVMQGLIIKNTVRDFNRGEYTGVAINLGFIFGSPYLGKLAQTSVNKGVKFVSEGKPLLGNVFKAGGPILSRLTTGFMIWALVDDIKEYNKGNPDALIPMIGDGATVTLEGIGLGAEMAATFGTLQGVAAIAVPVTGIASIAIFVSMDAYKSWKVMDNLDHQIHLTTKEKWIEGLRVSIGLEPEEYIKKLIEQNQINTQLINKGLQYLKENPRIRYYIFPAATPKKNCWNVEYKIPCSLIGLRTCYTDFHGRSWSLKTQTKEECKITSAIELNNTILINKKIKDIKWSRSIPEMKEGKIFCAPKVKGGTLLRDGGYYCGKAFGVEYGENRTANITYIELGGGKDTVIGFPESDHIVLLGNGQKNIILGGGNDTFIIHGKPTGVLQGGAGFNTLDLGDFAKEIPLINVDLPAFSIYQYDAKLKWWNYALEVYDINAVSLRKNKPDLIDAACNTYFIDAKGGKDSDNLDIISVPEKNCNYTMQLVLRPYTKVITEAKNSHFLFSLPNTEKSGDIEVYLSTTNIYRFAFNYTLYNIARINKLNDTLFLSFNNVNNNQTQSQSELTVEIHAKNSQDTIHNVIYQLKDNSFINVGKKEYYIQQATDSLSPETIIKDYPAIANHLNCTILVNSLLRNETIVVGHGRHEVFYNDPLLKSHLIGNGGENVYVIDSNDSEVLDFSKLPLPEVVLYDVDEERRIDTLVLKKFKKKIEKDLKIPVHINTRLDANTNDILIELVSEKWDDAFITVRLKDALITNWHKRLHVVLNHFPLEFEEGLKLRPVPLEISPDKTDIFIRPNDVEPNTLILFARNAGNYAFYRKNDNLIITNALDPELKKADRYHFALVDYYKNPKFSTLTLEFADKKIQLDQLAKKIADAKDFVQVFKHYQQAKYDKVFKSKSKNTKPTSQHNYFQHLTESPWFKSINPVNWIPSWESEQKSEQLSNSSYYNNTSESEKLNNFNLAANYTGDLASNLTLARWFIGLIWPDRAKAMNQMNKTLAAANDFSISNGTDFGTKSINNNSSFFHSLSNSKISVNNTHLLIQQQP